MPNSLRARSSSAVKAAFQIIHFREQLAVALALFDIRGCLRLDRRGQAPHLTHSP
jgi:hypothetical protein